MIMDALPSRVRAFVHGSACTKANVDALKTYFVQLPTEGWLIELARTHGRAILGAWLHDDFAAWIGLRGDELGRAYRLMLRRPDNDREELVQLARRLINAQTAEDITSLQRSAEMMRFRRVREDVERRTEVRQGRPTVESPTSGPITKQVEAWRMQLRVSVNDWSGSLGMSAPTYVARLAAERNPSFRTKIEQLAKDGKTLYRKLSAPVVARYDVVTRQEMEDAYCVIAADIETLRNDLLSDGQDLTVNDTSYQPGEDGEFLPLDLYSWMRAPEREEETA